MGVSILNQLLSLDVGHTVNTGNTVTIRLKIELVNGTLKDCCIFQMVCGVFSAISQLTPNFSPGKK